MEVDSRRPEAACSVENLSNQRSEAGDCLSTEPLLDKNRACAVGVQEIVRSEHPHPNIASNELMNTLLVLSKNPVAVGDAVSQLLHVFKEIPLYFVLPP